MKTKTENTFEPASFRDPSGFVFYRTGKPFRQINQSYAETYDRLMDSGLYADLVDRELLIPHQDADIDAPSPDTAYLVIEPEEIRFVSYPYEWCFGQLKDAALLTLEIQRRAMGQGLGLKDASAFNIQFHRGRPILIDTLSFEQLDEREPWIGYRQFCQHFLAPLSLMARKDVRLGRLVRSSLDGLPLDLTSKILPIRTWLSPALLLHIHLHARAQKRFAGDAVRTRKGTRAMSDTALQGLVASLESAIRGLNWEPKSNWADYEVTHSYSEGSLDAKESVIRDLISQVGPSEIWDIGANTGNFSRIATSASIPVVSLDIDYGAVEINYRRSKSSSDTYMLPLVIDLTNPTPALGWSSDERKSLIERGPVDLVMALALVHHLAIGNNVPLDDVARFLAMIGRALIIEFIPKSDPQVKRLLMNRADIFPDYTLEGFERSFSAHFELQRSEPLPESDRRLFLMRALR